MIEELHKRLLDGKDIVEESIEKAHKYQKEYNSFVTIIDNPSKKTVNENILSGIPYAAKDNLSTKDITTTGSSNILKNYIPFFNATAISKLNDSVLIGKTVLDELAMGGTGTTGHTGVVKNPWNKERIIGGSSSGSASCVALGIVPFALGSDTGDSIRKPAIYSGIVGFKPTYGLISRYGLFPFACSLDHVGTLTRSVKDAAIVVDAIKGKDEKDLTSIESNYKLTDKITGDIKNKKLFYIKEIIEIEDNDSEFIEIIKNYKENIQKLKNLGAIIEEISIDRNLLKALYPSYFIISCAEATSNNSNLTGISFGSRVEGENAKETIFNTRTKGFSELIKRRFIIGSFVLQKENQNRLYLNSCRIRRVIKDKFTLLFEKYDALILPGSGSVAPLIKTEILDKLSDKYLLLENHMIIANFGGFPSISIPTGFANEMPIGISITSGIRKDGELLNIAYTLENELKYKGQIAKGGNL
ncbi:MAG: amidase family protein [Bacilli bacterium]